MTQALRSKVLWSKVAPVVLEPDGRRASHGQMPDDDRRPARWWRKWAVLLSLGAVVAIAATALRYRNAPAADYATALVGRGDIARITTASGMVNPVETVQIGSYVSGRIQELSCDYNSAVIKGQSCAKIDPRSYQAAVEQSMAAVATAKAQLGKDQAHLTYAKVTYERNLTLANRNVVSQDAADNALNVYEQAKAQVELDQAVIDQRGAELKSAQVNLDYTDIVSPVDGTVVSRSASIGQTVTANFQTPTLFLIATDLKKMQVEANVNEAEIGEIRPGQQATFTVEAFPGRTFTGQVTQIRQAPVSVQNVISYDVVIAAANSDLELKPGMTATAHIAIARRHDVLRIPQAALRFAPDGTAVDHAAAGERTGGRVWVHRRGGLEPVAVALGLADDNDIEVTDGDLKAGDEVVTGRHRAGSGSEVAAGSAAAGVSGSP
jgi:HlyD family secretion protein